MPAFFKTATIAIAVLAFLVTTYTLPPDKLARAIEHARAVNRLYFIAVLYGFLVLGAILKLHVAPRYRDWAERLTRRRILSPYIFAPLLLLTIDLLQLPIAMRYHWLAVHYDQSIEPWGPWLLDWAKGEAIDLAVSGFLVWLLYCFIRRSPRRWWLWGWVASIPLMIFSVFAYPLLVEPLFYRFTPLAPSHPELVADIEKLTARAGLSIPRDRIFEMNASSKLKSINAYVTGIGASKRVVVWDNTLKVMTPAQTLAIFGHEMGHYVLHHIPIGMALSSAGILLMLFAAYQVFRRLGIRLDDYASLPALLLAMAIFDFVSTPVQNSISRIQEHNADVYGLEVTRGIVPNSAQAAAESFQIMGEISLADPSPSPFIEFWLYSHPSVADRVKFASEYDPKTPKYVP